MSLELLFSLLLTVGVAVAGVVPLVLLVAVLRRSPGVEG